MDKAQYHLFVENLEYARLINNRQKDIYGDRIKADWLSVFLNRLERNQCVIPISMEDFIETKEIVVPLKAYGINPHKFWVALNFAYDLTMDRCCAVRTDRNTIDVFQEVSNYIENHPQFKIYVSDDPKIPVKNRCEINNPCMRYLFSVMVRKYISEYDSLHNIGVDIMTRYWDNDDQWFRADKGQDLGQGYRIYYMYELIDDLFRQIIADTRLRRKKNENNISYNKRHIISQLIYAYKLTFDVRGYVESTDGLNGVIQQCKGRVEKFNVLSEVYTLL